jgi:outer membrane receptor protein involved in Fe transport
MNPADKDPNINTFGKAWTVNYALPVWGGAYGQLDMGLHYKVTDNMSVAFEAQNLNNAIYRQYVQQGIGLMEKGSSYIGRRYTLQASYSF